MDFLDPKKQRTQRYIFGIGYALIAVAILIATIILIYLSYGYSVGKNGQIIQNGLVFISAQPNTANIFVNGQQIKKKTDTSVQLPAGDYSLRLTRAGYRDWQRNITIGGATVQHFDYPFLIPQQLTTTVYKAYVTAPSVSLQSPDHRWLLTGDNADPASFLQYDLNNPKQSSKAVAIPAAVLTKPDAGASEAISLVEWSTDNKHVLLSHTYGTSQEYLLFNRDSPQDSVNLTRTLKLAPGQTVSLRNKSFDSYFVLDPAAQTLSTADLNTTTLTPYLEKVLAYKSYGSDTVLYASSQDMPADKTQVILRQNGVSYNIRQISAQPPYLLDLTKYSGTLYTALGASGDSEVYVYQDPVGQQQLSPTRTMVPVSILRISNPNYVSFSANAQFIMIENGAQFAVYDAENDAKFTYTVPTALDAGQNHAVWMDGDRLTLVSGGKLILFDYDHTNAQTLVAADGRYAPIFNSTYKVLYTLAPAGAKAPSGVVLTATSLLAKSDQ